MQRFSEELLSQLLPNSSFAMATDTSRLQSFPSKPRVFILSDISNEPDDAESLVRYLLYSNQFNTEGLVACTSTWMKTKVCPQDMHKIVDAYAGAVDNLNSHAHPDFKYPSAEYLKSIIKSGPSVSFHCLLLYLVETMEVKLTTLIILVGLWL